MARTPAHGYPVVWLLLSDKTGDNAQLMVVAEALPWPCQIRRIAVREPYRIGKPKIAGSLHHIDAAQSDSLQPPWPELVITIGRRLSMVALWIKAQSGGRTKVALLGPPKGMDGSFDLVVVSEQYRQRPQDNMLRIMYPLQRVDEAAISTEAALWQDEFAPLARPLTAVLVGGLTKAVRFDVDAALSLADDLAGFARREQGTLVVTTSRRTPPEASGILAQRLPPGAVFHPWSPDGRRNPYRALLGLADRFIVTSDSLSMLMEVARLGRPLAIYRLPPSSWLAGFLEGKLGQGTAARRLLDPLAELAERMGALGHHRNLNAIPRSLKHDGFAVWFGEPFRREGPRPVDQLPDVVGRIVALVEPPRAHTI